MPTIKLKSSGRLMQVSEEGLKTIKANPDTANLYEYPKTQPPAQEPEEVTSLRRKKKNEQAGQEGGSQDETQ